MTNSCLPGWFGEGFLLKWKFVFLFMDLLEDWLPAGCGGWLGWLASCFWLGWGVRAGLAGRGVAGGPWGRLLGRWSAVRTALRCSAVGRWRGTHCALPGAKLRSDSRAKFDVEVRLAAHPPHGLRASPSAKSPPPRPARHTTWGGVLVCSETVKSRSKVIAAYALFDCAWCVFVC